jgi:regulator of telomere elongation helicase 1
VDPSALQGPGVAGQRQGSSSSRQQQHGRRPQQVQPLQVHNSQLGAKHSSSAAGAGGVSKANGSSVGPGRPPPTAAVPGRSVASAAAGARGSAGAGGPCRPCCLCKKAPMDAAHAAPCGHLGCFSCWLGLLAKNMRGATCPSCGKAVRHMSHLKQAAFA